MGGTLIDGVIVTPLKRIANPKGDVIHALKRSAPGYAGFGEAYFSTAFVGVIKGWKRHRRVTLNLVVPVGHIRFVVHDDRPSSHTVGAFLDLTLGEANHARLTVPPGLCVAFVGAKPGLNLLMNVIDEEHDPSEAENVELAAIAFDWSHHG